MQKKIIALAVAGLMSGAAFAQSNVTIYGSMAAGFENARTTGNAAGTIPGRSYNRVQDQTSRIGFRGTEDLGGGLSAIWQIETGLDLSGSRDGVNSQLGGHNLINPVANSGSSSLLGNRNTFIGLKGNFGTVLMGRHDTPYKLAGQKVNVFVGTTADYSGIIGGGSQRFDLRAQNALAYVSPNFSGFSAAIAHVPNEARAVLEPAKPSAWSLMAAYDNGPIHVAYGYEKHNDFNTYGAAATGLNIAPTASEKANKLVGAFTFAPGSLVGLVYEEIKGENSAAAAGAKSRKEKHYGVSGQYTMGQMAFKAQYLKAKDSVRDNGTPDTGAKFWTLGLDYALSKRTTAYAMYAKMSNDAAGTRNFLYSVGDGTTISATSGAVAVTAGADVSVLGLGLRHSF